MFYGLVILIPKSQLKFCLLDVLLGPPYLRTHHFGVFFLVGRVPFEGQLYDDDGGLSLHGSWMYLPRKFHVICLPVGSRVIFATKTVPPQGKVLNRNWFQIFLQGAWELV